MSPDDKAALLYIVGFILGSAGTCLALYIYHSNKGKTLKEYDQSWKP